jgi:hypothetical protein
MMENTSPDLQNKNAKREPSWLWRILRLVPISLMLVSLGILIVMFLMGGLLKISAWYLLQVVPPLLGLVSLLTILIYAAVKKKFGRLMSFTLIVSLISLLPAILLVRPVTFPASLESTEPAATIRVPADVPLKVAWGGDSIETNYHAAVPDQRWAYDLLAEPYVTGSDQLEDYGCYGIPIAAPASGLVTIAHDGEPDEVPGVTSNNLEAPTGNYVVIQLPDTGTYLVIAHMKPGSVVVKAGDNVEEGQKIGECGNSGNTSEPHIHIHHQRQDPAVLPINFAEGLPLYFRDHDGDPMPVGGIEVNGETVTLIGDTIQHLGE